MIRSIERGVLLICVVVLATAHTAQAGVDVWSENGPGRLYAGTSTGVFSIQQSGSCVGDCDDDGDVDEDGYNLEGGIRWKIVDMFEFRGQVNRVDYGDAGDDTTVEVAGLFTFLKDRIGAGASYESGDADTARVFGRFNFGK